VNQRLFTAHENPGIKQVEARTSSFANSFSGVTQQVNDNSKHNEKKPAGQGAERTSWEPLKIGLSAGIREGT
jgi:hypothetical protein